MRMILLVVLASAAIAFACGDDDGLDERGIVNDCRPESDAPARDTGDSFTTEGGVEVEVLEGPPAPNPAQAGDEITVHYVGSVVGEDPFDDTRERDAPFTFTINTEGAICGWVEGVVGMSPGETRQLTIPPELAYGDVGFGDIVPPAATLVFEIEMIEFAPTPPEE